MKEREREGRKEKAHPHTKFFSKTAPVSAVEQAGGG